MKKLLTATLLFAIAILPSAAKDHTVPLLQNVLAYESLSLNGEWNYIVDVQEEGYYDYRMNPTPWGFFRNAKPQRPEDLVEYDFDKSPTMHIPGDWNTQDERLFFYEGTIWFKKNFEWKSSQSVASDTAVVPPVEYLCGHILRVTLVVNLRDDGVFTLF